MKKVMQFYINHFENQLFKIFRHVLWLVIISYLFLKFILEVPSIKSIIPEWLIVQLRSFSFGDYWFSVIEINEVGILASIIAAIFAIAIPISLTVISLLDKKYKQGGIAWEFLKEPINSYQYNGFLTNVLIIVSFVFFDSINPFFWVVYIIYFLMTIINFIAYILLMIKYLTDAKSQIYPKCYHAINKYFDE